MMKKTLLLFSFFLISLNVYHSQNIPPRKVPKPRLNLAARAVEFIDVNTAGYNESAYNITQLVKEVLISSGTTSCGPPNVSNVQVTPNRPATNINRAWGYFNRKTTNFPFEEGIVLVTGKANKVGNNYIDVDSPLSDIVGTGGDPDLATAVNSSNLTDGVKLEFDFVPTSSQIKFNYLFASEEYTGKYPCSYTDSFALFLRPTSGGPYVNMAVLPNGAPVSIKNIHLNTQFDGSPLTCGAMNPAFFGGYNTTNIETNFNGRTIPLTATATVIPGQSYHFKMVIAESYDTDYDTAVFLEGRSFNIGVNLLDPNGVNLPSEINVCDNTPQVLTASVNDPTLIYRWYYNGVLLQGATTHTITVTQPGTYTIEVGLSGSQCPGKASVQIHGGITPVANDATVLLCSTPDETTFNLVAAEPLLSSTPNAVFRFYENQADATAQNNNYIATPLAYTGNDGQILYVVVSNGGFCSKMVELKLLKETTPTAQVTSSKLKICPGEFVTLTATGGTTYSWSNYSGTGNIQTTPLYNTTTFKVYAIGAKGCRSLDPATVTVEVVPEITSALKDVEICTGDRVTLDAGAGPGYKYLWSTGETTQTILVSQLGVYSVTIDNGYCTRVFTSKVTAAKSPFITALDYNNSNTLTITAENPPINNTPGVLEYSIDGGVSWQVSNVFPGLLDNTTYKLQVRIQGTRCIGMLDFFTLKIVNIITPNQDGINDVLDLTPLGNFNDFTGSIYDRYGVEIFRFTKDTPVWDGTLKGKGLSTATYWYKLTFQYPQLKTRMNLTGWILLKNKE